MSEQQAAEFFWTVVEDGVDAFLSTWEALMAWGSHFTP